MKYFLYERYILMSNLYVEELRIRIGKSIMQKKYFPSMRNKENNKNPYEG